MRASSLAPFIVALTSIAFFGPGCGADAANIEDSSSSEGSDAGSTSDRDASEAAESSPVGDASSEDASDASSDASDASSDASDASNGDGGDSSDAAVGCAPATIDYAATPAEATAVSQAVAAFEAAHAGVSITLNGASKSVEKIEGEVPVSLDAKIADPCDRAIASLQAFFTANASLLRLPPGLTKKSCTYDDVTDSEVVRLEGGTYYGGRPLVGAPTELLIHVRRDGHIRYWRADYVAVLERAPVTPCLDQAGAAAAAVGTVLHYSKYKACSYKGPGEVTLASDDSYVPLGTGVFVDASNRMHFVRLVDGFLAPKHVTVETGNSDLYCCITQSTKNCVGKTLAVDERTGEVLGEYPRCHTC